MAEVGCWVEEIYCYLSTVHTFKIVNDKIQIS